MLGARCFIANEVVKTKRRNKQATQGGSAVKNSLPGLTEKSPFLVQALFHLSSQIKHLLMHFCKLPHLTLGPADQSSKSSLWTEARRMEQQGPGKCELKALSKLQSKH